MLNELKNIKSTTKELREFGLTIGAILVILGDLAMWREKPSHLALLSIGSLFAVLGLGAPRILKWPQKVWMAFAVLIGFVMSRVILTALFYAVITPIGLIAKLFGKDMLDERIEKGRSSYWIDKSAQKKSKESYENQY